MKATKAILITILLLATGVIAKAENGWNIESSTSGSVTTFTITRDNTAVAETVKYRLVNLSAYAGQHYNVTQVNGQSSSALTGEFTFTAGDTDSRTIQVTESTGDGVYAYYKDTTQRSYKLEITDAGGFYLTSKTRSFTKGTSINSSNVYAEKSVDVDSGPITVTHDGFDQGYHAIPIATYFNNAAPKAYLVAAGAELRMVVVLDEAEKDDGYQHIQFLVNKTTSFDDSANEGNPGTPTNSHYLASFAHKPGSTLTTYATVCFPLTSASDNCSAIDPAWNFSPYSNSVGKLYTQKFKSGYRADDGKLLVAKKSELNSLSTVGIRFDASGDNADTWYAKNVTAKFTAVDETAPTKTAISVAPGYHAKGNTVYVSVAFSEIVTVSDTPTLSTNNNWGSLSYVAGTGTNVLTFRGTIGKNATDNLVVSGFSGTITDLAGNALGSITSDSLCSLDASYAYTITYNLNEGSVATDNPTSYTWETATITLNNPTKTGYVFNGWTGSNGDTPQTTVTVANHSHGNKSYTANWTQVWTGSGTQGAPYTISSTQGLDWLAQYVNSGNNCSGLFFQLGGNIAYTYTNAWNVVSEENNYTAIGSDGHPFQGTFDGQGYTVSGIRIYKSGDGVSDRHLGLFGLVENGGTVRNVNLADARITGYRNVGGIVGNALTNSTVEDCTVDANVCFHTVQSSAMYHGGIAGYCSGSVFRCISRANLTIADNLTDLSYYGGIAGYHSIGNLTDCIAEGVVIPAVSSRGAILGKNGGSYSWNYYRSCTVAGVANATGVGCNGADTYGARALYAVTLGPNVTISRNASATLPGTNNKTYTNGADIAGVPYAYASSNLSLSYNSAAIPAGYNLTVSAETTSGTTVDVTDNGDYTYTLTMPAAEVTVSATLHTTLTYIDADGNAQDHLCILIVSGITGYGDSGNDEGWYCVGSDVTISGTQGVQFLDQAVYIVLCDGATLTSNVTEGTNAAIKATNGPLTIYGQSLGTGKLVTSGRGHGIYVKGNISFYGGTISSTSSSNMGVYCNNGNATILRGSVTAQGSNYGISSKNVSISGGIVIAEGSSSAIYASNNINISGGTVTAHCTGTSEDRSGLFSYGGNTNIQGGIVTATGPAGIQAGITGGYGLKTITLGYTSATDRITASSYVCATLKVKDDQTLYDGNTAYSGTLTDEQKAAIATKTLTPNPGASGSAGLLIANKASLAGQERYWTTFYHPDNKYSLPYGAQAFIMKSDHALYRLGDGSVIPAGCAVVVMADASALTSATTTSGTITLSTTSAADPDASGNILLGVDTDTARTSLLVGSKKVHVMHYSKGEIGFYTFSGNTVPAHKAYYLE